MSLPIPSHDGARPGASSTTRDVEKGASLTNRKRAAGARFAASVTSPEAEYDLDGEEHEKNEKYEKSTTSSAHEGDGSRFDSVWSSSRLDQLLDGECLCLETYDLTEFRDGFCDATFLNPRPAAREALLTRAERNLPVAFQKKHPLSLKHFLPGQWRDAKSVVRRVLTTRAGIKLAKSFIAFFTAYVLCLIPSIRAWLGRYNYILVVSTIINHPGRTVGGQIDGTVMTILGTATGLGWGAFGLWLSTSSSGARIGYAPILALFLGVYIGIVAALRSYFLRMYQFAICAGLAVAYTCLAQVSSQQVAWDELFEYGVPWVLGQAICLITCLVVFPDGGARGVAVTLNDSFKTMLDGLDVRKSHRRLTRRRLAQTFINLSHAYRDLSIEITLSRFNPKDILALRNALQAVVRSLLAMRPEPGTSGFEDVMPEASPTGPMSIYQALVQSTVLATPGLSEVVPGPLLSRVDTRERAVRLVRYQLEDPTKSLLRRMTVSLQACHAVLMDMSGYRQYLGPPKEVESDIAGALVDLRRSMIKFDEAESSLMDGHELDSKFVPGVIEIFAYCRPIRQAATAIEAVLVRVNEIEQRKPKWAKIYLPSYPWKKALNRVNAQVRHDRGGLTAAAYYKSFADIQRLINTIKSIDHEVIVDEQDMFKAERVGSGRNKAGAAETEDKASKPRHKKGSVRHRIWMVAHRLQGFEMRFAFKTVVVMSLLSLPAWLSESQHWWEVYESWWAVAMAWLMMHPRVGGNLQDLITRALMAALGAIWAGAGYAARNGNPIVMGAFAAIFMLPMIYRFTQSSHPRSGLVGCVSFTVTSLALITNSENVSPPLIAVSRGAAFVVGVVAAVTINWIIWPFVARHELRKAMSDMMFFLSITYRSVIGRYVYYDRGYSPTKEDIERSEILEGRLREGFVRIRQVMALTRHEIRLRGPFDPRAYSALADSCERFFEYLVAVRQSALFFHPKFVTDNDEAAERLLSYRRDAVAAILMNLYILAGSLRADRKVPKFLPSAAASRKQLMTKMAELEAEYEEDKNKLVPQMSERRKWVQIYQYSYNESLTGCVAQLEELERYTKLIVGEHGFDDIARDESSGEESHGSDA